MAEILVLGVGFAGLWAALGAARRTDELGATDVGITVVSSQPFHDIRVRNYEADLTECRISLSQLLPPAGVDHVTADVLAIDTAARTVITSAGARTYDRLVVALGSRVQKPALANLDAVGFDVDTYDGALRLQRHLDDLASADPRPEASTVVVVGAGLTGIETACELPARLAALFPGAERRVVLVDRNAHVGSDMGASARPVIEAALRVNGVEVRLGVGVDAVGGDGVVLTDGDVVPAATVVWCAGMRANPLAAGLGVPCDGLGRVVVDEYLRVIGPAGVFAAGDVAAAPIDGPHLSVMSCQHARPMGRFAGYNVVGDLLGAPQLPLQIPWYVTVLDLGPDDAVYTEGWDRRVVAEGIAAKATKQLINCSRIYPPLTGERADLLTAAAPAVQSAPPNG
ncbi:NADH dehydrogenase [Mycobacterium sp. Soil538]|nr:NADH dehydrogenase [Mycobacterium sp. Soil538]